MVLPGSLSISTVPATKYIQPNTQLVVDGLLLAGNELPPLMVVLQHALPGVPKNHRSRYCLHDPLAGLGAGSDITLLPRVWHIIIITRGVMNFR